MPVDAPFALHRAEVRAGVELAYWREGVGGQPLLLIHGWPETKRIWARNVAPLAAAGFEVIVPDLRGFGDSSLAPDGFYDLAANARDMYALVHDVLGHASCVCAAGDLGGGVMIDLGMRFPGLVSRQVVFNSILPLLTDAYAAAGLPTKATPEVRMAADYYVRQGRDADALLAELPTEALRRAYVAQFYGPRFWAAPGSFTRDEVDYMTEPFASADHLRAGWGNYESSLGSRPLSEKPCWFEPSPVPTLCLYGPDDHVLQREFPQMARVAFTELVGPFVVRDAGHFLQWEQADILNQTLRYFGRAA